MNELMEDFKYWRSVKHNKTIKVMEDIADLFPLSTLMITMFLLALFAMIANSINANLAYGMVIFGVLLFTTGLVFRLVLYATMCIMYFTNLLYRIVLALVYGD